MRNRVRKFFKKYSGGEVADNLESLGYFKYADPADVELLKDEVAQAYKAYGMISSIHALENGKHYPKDYRLYSLNNEALFEKGGFDKYLSEIKPTLRKLDIFITIEESRKNTLI